MNKPSIIPDDGTREIIAAALEVHRHLGPGLLESAYEECLCFELELRSISFERQKPLPISYKGKSLDCAYRLDWACQSVCVNGFLGLLQNRHSVFKNHAELIQC